MLLTSRLATVSAPARPPSLAVLHFALTRSKQDAIILDAPETAFCRWLASSSLSPLLVVLEWAKARAKSRHSWAGILGKA